MCMKKNDIRDSMMNNCFGIAQDLTVRGRDWGFRLSGVRAHVHMRHSRLDNAVPFVTAELTSKSLPNGTLEAREGGEHFSAEALDDFIRTAIIG